MKPWERLQVFINAPLGSQNISLYNSLLFTNCSIKSSSLYKLGSTSGLLNGKKLFIHVHVYVCIFDNRWCAAMVLKQIPIDQRPEVQLKCVAYDILQRKRQSWGLKRIWKGNYLAKPVGYGDSLAAVVQT